MKKERLNKLVLLALFVALIVLLGSTPLGLIPLGFVYVTILCVPVVIGTLLMGLSSGLVLGAAFGLTSFVQALVKPSTLVATLMGASPLLVFVLCVVPRLLIPISAFLTHKALRNKNEHIAVAASAVAGSLTNTVFYLGFMLLFYVLCGIDSSAVLGLIGGTAAIAGSCEAAVAAVLSAPILAALNKVKKR